MKIYEGYQIKASKEHPTLKIVVTDGRGGKVPDVLSGMYTSDIFAMRDIDYYLAMKPRKEKNAETGDKSGS